MIGTEVPKLNSKEERTVKKMEGKREAKCHLREKCYTTCVKGICHEFIKIYGSTSYTEGLIGVRK